MISVNLAASLNQLVLFTPDLTETHKQHNFSASHFFHKLHVTDRFVEDIELTSEATSIDTTTIYILAEHEHAVLTETTDTHTTHTQQQAAA